MQTSEVVAIHLTTPTCVHARLTFCLSRNTGNGNYQVRMWLFGVLPLGTQWIVIRHIASSEGYDLLDDGHGNLITRWQHLISLRPTPGGFTLYTDTVNIDARWLTFGVWLFANIFYRYRQSRWRRLVQKEFQL